MKLHITFSEGQKFSPIFTTNEESFKCEFGEFLIIHTADWYGGDYEITPTIEGKTYPTKDKTMREDLTMKAIPFAEVSNPQGGYTVNIGGN